MTLEELYKEIKRYVEEEVFRGGELEDMYNLWLSEMGYRKKDGDYQEFYAKKVIENFRKNLMVTESGQNPYSLSQEIQDVYDAAVEDAEDYASEVKFDDELNDFDDEAWREVVAELISEELKNPFENLNDYVWQPISYALDSIGMHNERALVKIEGATNGQLILLAYYINGTREELPWNLLMCCIG